MIYRWWPNLRYAVLGMKIAWRNEMHFRIHVLATFFVILAAFFFNVPALELALLLLACGFVIATETINTALEELCDKHTKEHDPHIARIKDLAAAVLISSLFATAVGLLIFGPYLVAYVSL
jgi:diacylglycerol kinase (ATP)